MSQGTRNGATSPASTLNRQSPISFAASGEGSDTLLVARNLIRLAAEYSPSSLPTPESLEMAASAYQVAMKIHQPSPSLQGTDNPARNGNPLGQSSVIENFHMELRAIREETSQAFLRLDKKFEALRGDIGSLKHIRASTIATSIEESSEPQIEDLNEEPAYVEHTNEEPAYIKHTNEEPANIEDLNEEPADIEDVDQEPASIEFETEVLEPSWDFDVEPTKQATKTTPPYAPELKRPQHVEERTRSYRDTAPPRREPVGSLRGSWGETRTSSEASKRPMNDNKSESAKTFFTIQLNTLTAENYFTVSNRIVSELNKPDREPNGATVKLVADLVFETAIDEDRSPDMYAGLCRKITEQLSRDIRNENMRDPAGELVVGGNLFRKYLLIKCQDYFERGWSTKTVPRGGWSLRGGESKANEDAPKTRRQGPGVVRFIGELFKLEMLNERIMHECIKKLIAKVDDPDEQELEGLCALLTTVGGELDTPKAKAQFDGYFGKIQMLIDGNKLSTALRSALLDLVELKRRSWRPRTGTTGSQAYSQIVKAQGSGLQQAFGNDRTGTQQRGLQMDQGTRSGFQWGGGRGGREQGPDGWNVAGPSPVRAPAKAGDLSNFGKFTTSPGPLKTMGPSSVFKRSPGARNNSLSPTGSLFNGTAGGDTSSGASSADAVDTMPKETRSEGGTTPKPGVEAPLRKKLQLLPRTISLTAANEDNTSNEAAPESDEDQTPTKSYTDEEAKAKVDEDVKEFFNIRDVTEGEKSFIELPKEHKSKLVDKLASKALDMKEDDVELVAQVFEKAAGKACPPSAFEEGLTGIMEFLEDTATDVPQVYNFMAKMLRGSKLPQETIESLADKIRVDGDPEVKPKDKLLKAYAALD